MGKVIKKIMDGSLLQLQRTNSHFQFASGRAWVVGVKANSFYWLDPCRPSLRGGPRVFSAAEEFHFEATSLP